MGFLFRSSAQEQGAKEQLRGTREGMRLNSFRKLRDIEVLIQQAIEVDPEIEKDEDGSREKDEDGLVKHR